MRFRANLDFYVENPKEASKVLESLLVLSQAPGVDQFTWSIKGQEPFPPERNGKVQRVDRRKVRARDTSGMY
jgi:hypothetical protein